MGVGIIELSHLNPLSIIEPLRDSLSTKNTLLYENQVKHWYNDNKSITEKQTKRPNAFARLRHTR